MALCCSKCFTAACSRLPPQYLTFHNGQAQVAALIWVPASAFNHLQWPGSSWQPATTCRDYPRLTCWMVGQSRWPMRLSLQPATEAYSIPAPLQGSWTAIHADVLSSYSWSSQICGRKRWRLLAPQHTHLLLDTFGRCTTLPWAVMLPAAESLSCKCTCWGQVAAPHVAACCCCFATARQVQIRATKPGV